MLFRASHVLVILALAAAAVVVGAASWRSRSARSRRSPGRDDRDVPSSPRWRPTPPVDIRRTVQTFAYYTDRKRAFAVFKHGTCVLLPDGGGDDNRVAKRILDRVYNHHPDFDPKTMDDGNFLVTYSQPAFSVVFKDEFANHRAYIEQHHLDGVVRAEVLLNSRGEANKFNDTGKIGLFGRARMFLDAQDPSIVEIWRPQQPN